VYVCVCELNVSGQEEARRCLLLSDAEGCLPKQDSDRGCVRKEQRNTKREKKTCKTKCVCVCVCDSERNL